ncbi:MAG: glutathione S-transferase family protein [Proteobacteria bacterium]|nr:glutathione S-transferase family protein [Pseudomonadota bacterium]
MRTPSARPAIFVTMPHSHYVEKARWALDRCGLAYREQPHVPLLHRRATQRHGGGSVPVLVDGGQRFVDSTDILVHADARAGGDRLYPRDVALRGEVLALEDRFDLHLGPHTRRWAYAHLLPEKRLLRTIMKRGVPLGEAMALPILLPRVVRAIRKHLKITPESALRSLVRVREMFHEVDERLADGRRYLVLDRFTAADLTFAALAAPALFPAGYRGSYPALDAVPEAMREEVLRLRDTDAGRFALRMFEQERGVVVGAG